jgi:Tfp pilus assembly protein FimT
VGVVKGTSILIYLAVIGLTLGIAIPNGVHARRRTALQSAADEVRSILLLARMRAAERDREVGIRFVKVDGAWHHIMYDDGNGDGVRRDDIARGIDPPAAPPYPVLAPGAVAVEHINDPALCVFTPDGDASPCVIAIADGDGGREHVTQRCVS